MNTPSLRTTKLNRVQYPGHFHRRFGGSFAGVAVFAAAAVPCLFFVVGGQDAEDDRQHFLARDGGDSAGPFAGDKIEMRRFAADHRAQTDDRGESPGLSQCLGGQRQFEGAGEAMDSRFAPGTPSFSGRFRDPSSSASTTWPPESCLYRSCSSLFQDCPDPGFRVCLCGMPDAPTSTEKFATRQRCELLDITDLVSHVVANSGIRSGIAVVFVPHTTAGVTINENADPDVRHDLLKKLETLVPHHESFYQHSEGNSDAHVKSSLLGHSASIPIYDGKLELGTWQAIYFAEFDGPRERRVMIKVLGQ